MIRRLFLLVLAMLAASPASAQLFERSGPAPLRDNAIQPELLVQGPATPGKGTELAIVMHTRQGWHGYWLNPGDAGLPMQVEWTLPPGWKVEPLRYPVPQKLLVAGIVNYVYERDYAVLTRIVPPAGATGTGEVSASMRWLACTDKVCVPEEGEVAISVPTTGAASPDPRFDQWLRALPRPLGSQATYQLRGDRIVLAVPLPASVKVADPYFFPAQDGPVDYAAPQKVRRSGDTLVVELGRRNAVPAKLTGVLAIAPGRGLAVEAAPGAVPQVSGPAPLGLAWAILGALLGGLILNLMPCVLPILGLKAMHLARAGGDQRHARRDALGYTLGAVLGTGALGIALLVLRAAGEAAGWAFQLQDPRTVLVLLLLAVAITLNLLRAFELPALGARSTAAGSVATGALAAFVATPCAGPFMGAALGAALLLPAWGAVAVFAALGLGLALPFLVITFVPALRRRLPKPGPWMVRLQRILAVPMALSAAAALWLLWRQGGAAVLAGGAAAALLLAAVLVAVGRAQRAGRSLGFIGLAGSLVIAAGAVLLLPAQTAGRSALADPAWSPAAVASARAAGHPVFVYFTADWCLTCKANEAAAIDRQSTREAFEKAGVTVLAGDWTDGDPAITRFLESRGRAGVPYYLWYAPGRAEPEELPQILTPGLLTAKAR